MMRKSLIAICKQLDVKINVIEIQKIDQQISINLPSIHDKFIDYQKNKVIERERKKNRGKDIDAACGQLAKQNK